MQRTNYGLKDSVVEEIISLAKKYDIDRLVLFGSRARGTYSRASDIDLAAYGGNVNGFAVDAEETVQTLLRFDVIDMGRKLSPQFREEIERGIVLYAKV